MTILRILYRRLTYRLEHCEADWKPSVGLFESDVVDGFIAGNTIDDIKESTLTNTLYTHYHLDIPNDKCQPKFVQAIIVYMSMMMIVVLIILC